MNFDPQKWFIGLMDFFTILLPGALIVLLIGNHAGPLFLGDQALSELTDWKAGAAFLFGSYLWGHFVYLLGSWLDPLYDLIRAATPLGQIRRLARGRSVSPAWLRWLTSLWITPTSDLSARLMEGMRDHYMSAMGDARAINAYQWSKARLIQVCPEALAKVERFEADSKFFRSLVVVLLLLMLFLLVGWVQVESPLLTSAASLVLVALAFPRYIDQRLKSVNQAYWYLLAYEASRDGGYRAPAPSAEAATHGAGVVFRKDQRRKIAYLLVPSLSNHDEWVLTKGHVEPGETPLHAAIRESHEEAGVWAAYREDLGEKEFKVQGVAVRVRYFLLEMQAMDNRMERPRYWHSLEECLARLSHEEAKDILCEADKRLRVQATN